MLTRSDCHHETDQPWVSLPTVTAPEPDGMTLDLLPRHALAGGALRAAEASLRWGAPGLASDRQACTRLGAWLLGRACREAQDWNAVQDVPRIAPGGVLRFSPAVMVSVEMSMAFLRDGQLVAQARNALAQSGLAPWLLEIALPAQVMSDGNADLVQNLSALRDLRIGLVLEDFGSLTASPRWLQRLKPTAVKLDPALVRDLLGDHAVRGTVKAAIGLAHGLGARVVAPDVKTAAQRDILTDLGCDDAQGMLYGASMRPEKFLAALMRPRC